MDFYVYDNIYTYNKRHPFTGVRNTRLEIKSIDIPENHSFWFYTDMQLMVDNVNLQKRYVHIHPGVGSTNEARFNKEPLHVDRTNMKYSPEDKRVEIGSGFLKKPVYAKKCIYYGSEAPKKKMTIVGEWFYDHSDNSIHLILDWNSQKISFHWEEGYDEPSTAEQLNRIAELELKIELSERLLKEKSIS